MKNKTETEKQNKLLPDPISRITVATGLSGFQLLSRIKELSGETVAAVVDFDQAAPYLGIEALAQAGTYHVRFLCDFSKQAVLLAIKDCMLPEEETLQGRFDLAGRLLSRSASVFAYEMSAVANGRKVLDGEFVFTAVGYNSDLREDILRKHYKERLACLRKG
jgi:hypothetical protein